MLDEVLRLISGKRKEKPKEKIKTVKEFRLYNFKFKDSK